MIGFVDPRTDETFYAETENVIEYKGYRSVHPVLIFGETPDVEDWFYRILDKYNDELIGRYDRGPHFQKILDQATGIVLFDFEEWKVHSSRTEYANLSFEEFIDKIEEEKRIQEECGLCGMIDAHPGWCEASCGCEAF